MPKNKIDQSAGHNTEVVKIRIDKSVKEFMEKEADRQCRPFQDQVRFVLREFMNSEKS